MNLEQMKKIVDGAPSYATSVVVSKCGNYALYGRGNQSGSRIMLDDLRTELRARAPRGATHYDFENGKPVFFKKNDLGFTFKSNGGAWQMIKVSLNSYKRL